MLIQFFSDNPYVSALVAFLIGWAFMPMVVRVAKARDFVVKPNKRTSHVGAVPNVGGINIFISFFLTVALFAFQVIDRLQFIFIGIFLILLVGFVDDLIDIRASWKLAGQLLAGVFVIVLGDYRLTSFQGFLGIGTLPMWVSYAVSFFVFVVLNNALNLIDGVDGLASGLGILYCLFFGVYFMLGGYPMFALCAFTLVGALAVFFIYNVFGGRNKIFMGDCGSLFLGYMIYLFVCQFCEVNAARAVPAPYAMRAAPAVAVCVLMVPLFDTMRVMLTRIKQGRSPFAPDRNHIHHLLLGIGLKHRQVTFVLLAVSVLFIGLGVLGRNWPIGVLTLAGVGAMTLFTFVLWRVGEKLKMKVERGKYKI